MFTLWYLYLHCIFRIMCHCQANCNPNSPCELPQWTTMKHDGPPAVIYVTSAPMLSTSMRLWDALQFINAIIRHTYMVWDELMFIASVALNYRFTQCKINTTISTNNQYRYFSIKLSSFQPHMGNNELSSLRCGHMAAWAWPSAPLQRKKEHWVMVSAHAN